MKKEQNRTEQNGTERNRTNKQTTVRTRVSAKHARPPPPPRSRRRRRHLRGGGGGGVAAGGVAARDGRPRVARTPDPPPLPRPLLLLRSDRRVLPPPWLLREYNAMRPSPSPPAVRPPSRPAPHSSARHASRARLSMRSSLADALRISRLPTDSDAMPPPHRVSRVACLTIACCPPPTK